MTKSAIALFAAMLLIPALHDAEGASVSRSYKYFSIRGSTLSAIEKELSSRGPKVESTGKRHPGSTELNFAMRVTYGKSNGRCWVDDARVNIHATVTLPRWKPARRPESDVRLIWETLAADIKRHEESHIVIAKNHARELEQSIKAISRHKTCATVASKVQSARASILRRHDAEQLRFDRIEAINFEKRILSLLQYRLEREAAAKAKKRR